MNGFSCAEVSRQGLLLLTAVGKGDGGEAVSNGNAGNGVDADIRVGIVLVVIVAALHERTLRIEVAQPHVDRHWRVEVCQNSPRHRFILKGIHKFKVKSFRILLPFACCSNRSLRLCRHDR